MPPFIGEAELGENSLYVCTDCDVGSKERRCWMCDKPCRPIWDALYVMRARFGRPTFVP